MLKNRTTHIYGIHLINDFEIRYVGKTVKSIRERFNEHLKNADLGVKTPICHWIRKHKGKVEVVLLAKTKESNWKKAEIYFIKRYREKGHRLLNVTDGGDGCVFGEENYFSKNKFIGPDNYMYGKTHTKEARKKMSESLKGKMIGEKNPMYGGTHTPEVRKRLSEYFTGTKMKEETKRKIAKSMMGDKNHFYGKTHSKKTLKILDEKIFSKLRKKVIQFDKDTGEFIKEFDSLKEAQTAFPFGNIGDTCRGKQKQAGGYGWKYKE